VFDAEQLKSALPITRAGTRVIPLSERFSPDRRDIRYRTADAATATATGEAVTRTLAEHFDSARGWVSDFLAMRKQPESNLRPDITKADRMLRTIANYAKKVPALKLIFQAALDFSTNRHLYGERVFGVGEMLVGDLAKFARENAAAWKAKVEPYLWEQDTNAVGPRVAREGDEWVIYSASRQRLGATTREAQAWAAAHLAEVQELLADGWSAAEAEAVFKVRTINDNTWSMLSEDARRMAAECEALGIPPVPVVLADGTAIDLQQALREMGDRRGYYMPRLRKAGRYELLATKDGVNPIREHFDTHAGRAVTVAGKEHANVLRNTGVREPGHKRVAQRVERHV
jgi:hypothetical protein